MRSVKRLVSAAVVGAVLSVVWGSATAQGQAFPAARPLIGVALAIVVDNQPDNAGRIRVKFPWLAGHEDQSFWARVVLPVGGAFGTIVVPEVNDEVLVAFEHGDVARPYVIGSLWNGVCPRPQLPPAPQC